MYKTTVLTISIWVFLLLAMLGAAFVMPVAASSDIWVPTLEYPTIQAAIDAANPGDVIHVASDIYYERLVVNKSLTLVGEDSSTTIIDGNGTGIVVRINAPDVEIRGFTVQNAGDSPNSSIHLGGCVRNTVRDNIIRNNAYGIALMRSNDSIIVGNRIMNNSLAGIHIRDSSNNIIHYNTMVNNSIGVLVTSESSLFNMLYHNNFIENLNQAQDFGFNTSWDNGAEGNYWSDYTGLDDASGNRTAGDGVGDTLLPHEGDWYPLMEPWSPYRVFRAGTWDEVTYYVTTFSNSTVASFNFSVPLKRISFIVTSGASGFCNVTIPIGLLDGDFTVRIDYEQAPVFVITQNGTHSFLYFTYNHGTHYVEVYGTAVIPEFPWSLSMSMFLVVLTILLVFIRRKE